MGGIKTVHSKLLIQCADGSRCVINDVEATGLEDFNEKRDCVSKCIVKHVFLYIELKICRFSSDFDFVIADKIEIII